MALAVDAGSWAPTGVASPPERDSSGFGAGATSRPLTPASVAPGVRDVDGSGSSGPASLVRPVEPSSQRAAPPDSVTAVTSSTAPASPRRHAARRGWGAAAGSSSRAGGTGAPSNGPLVLPKGRA